MDCLKPFLQCCSPRARPQPVYEKSHTGEPIPYADDAASQFVDILRTAEVAGPDLEYRLKQVVSANGWTESLAEAILAGIERIINDHLKMAVAMADATAKATKVALEFAKEHPVYTALIAAGTIVAIGVLVMLAPWVLQALGFANGGIRGGSFAARWMSRIAKTEGHVSKESLYSYLQSLGMRW